MNPNLDELRLLKKKIENLTINEKEEIVKILNNNEFNYTKNKNGIFINMNNLSDDIIIEINNLIEFSYNNINIEKERIDNLNQLNKN